VDALVFCQGVIRGRNLERQTNREIFDTFHTNTIGAITLTKALLPVMANHSSITYVSSLAAFAGSFDPVYAASKGALVSLAKSLAQRLGPRTRVNVVAPGLTSSTGMFDSMKASVRQRHIDSTYLRKLATPSDVARAVFFLASSSADHVTGATLDVNGGEYLR